MLIAAAVLIRVPSRGEEIRVAVAGNFRDAMTVVADRFESNTPHRVTLSFGSTGKHYAQIMNGAPFDAFFAADVRHPEQLEQEGLAIAGSRFTYAVGKLVLWSPEERTVDPEGRILERGEFRHLAMANASLAPYGWAALEVLEARGLWDRLRGRVVRGENISQTFHFVKSGNAELGFVAFAQVSRPDTPAGGSMWVVPQALYTPIVQQAVLLKESAPARAFMSFVRKVETRTLIESFGYETP
jgi:molybdate transport system substrate-binding protein